MRLTRGVGQQRRTTPFKRSISAKSVRSTRSKKSSKSNKSTKRLKSRNSRSRSSRGSRTGTRSKKLGSLLRGKTSVTSLSNAGNFTTLSMGQGRDSKRSTNIIIKGAFSTVKAKSSKKNLLGKKTTTTSDKVKKEKSERDLMEKLLTEITAKYKPHLCKNKDYLERLEKRSMIAEIQMLAQALISCDRATKKQHDNNEKLIRRLKNELMQSEE